MDIPGLIDVLVLLANATAVGPVIAFLFERLPWFQNISSKARFWVIFGISLGLPLAAQLLLQFVPPEVWAVLEPYWRALAAGFVLWSASQVAHRLDTRARRFG